MKIKQKLGSVKRFGARYGRKLKLKFFEIESEQRKLHKCPYCNKIAVKRMSVGIWNCKKCNAKFAGKAYSISKKIVTKEVKEAVEDEPLMVKGEIEDIEQTITPIKNF